jgi:N-acetylglucosaminyl-diphospho-decaprenol L-rhamnosyltransferase
MNSSQNNEKLIEEVTVIIVSYNTRDLTLKALETLYANAGNVRMQVIVWDNASADSSAEAIAAAYPEAELIRSPDNLGFAVANNRAAEFARAEWLLLLNPDTETYPRAVEAMLEFAKSNPEAGIVGGRTYFPDGSLNPQSCWNRITPWSLFCSATGLTRLFGNSTLFNPEGIGGWQRDTVRHVDIVVGCFLMIPTRLWRELGGFRDKYFMYGEEADLCLRAAKAGYRPMITPDAKIMHLVGASTPTLAPKLLQMARARVTLVRDHWSPLLQPLGLALMLLWSFNHWLQSRLERAIKGQSADNDAWVVLWQKRQEWLGGYS